MNPAHALIAAAVALHLMAVARPGSPLSLPGGMIVEGLAVISLAVFVGIRKADPNERRVASRSIFVSSLVLALTAPAALLPAAAGRAEFWAVGPGGASTHVSLWPFPIWAISFLLGGLAMHLLTHARGKRELAG
jgi:hypothetical protein